MRHTDKSLLEAAHSCLRRIEAANPAGPPPTISTSKAMLSRGGSVSSLVVVSSGVEEKQRTLVAGEAAAAAAIHCRRAAPATDLLLHAGETLPLRITFETNNMLMIAIL